MELYIEFLLNSLYSWAVSYDNKDKEDDFDTLYKNVYDTIYFMDGLTSDKRIKYFNELKDIKNKVY